MEFAEQIEEITNRIKTHRKVSRSLYYKVAHKHMRKLEGVYSELVGAIETFVECASSLGWDTRKSNYEYYQNYIGGTDKLCEYTIIKGIRWMTLYADKAGFVSIGVTHTDVSDEDGEYFLTGLDNKYAVKYLEVY